MGDETSQGRARSFGELLLAALISSAVVSVAAGILFTRYVTAVEEEVKSQRAWKERSVTELLGPIAMQLDRTKGAFTRWNDQNLYLEAKVMKAGNESVRDLLLAKGHLIPADLIPHANRLVQHYDVWLELYDRHRGGKEPDLKEKFVFAGPKDFPFPSEAEHAFKQRLRLYMKELYGV